MFLDSLTFDNMKRLGFRSAFVSTEEKVSAETKAPQSTEPQLFYVVCYCLYFFKTCFPFSKLNIFTSSIKSVFSICSISDKLSTEMLLLVHPHNR
jgi:hypothetical protein